MRLITRSTTWLAGFLTLFFLSPLFIVLFQFSNFHSLDFDDFFWALRQTSIQAIGSSFFSIVFGMIMAFGLAKLSSRWRSVFTTLAMIPSLMPAMLSILIVFSIVQPFPAGLFGIVVTHVFIFSGFASMHLFYLMKDRASGLIEVSYTFGARRWQVYREVIKMLWPEILSLGFIIFTISFASFSVPIAVGGGKGTTLEVLIYEKIRLSGDWGQAVVISLMQIFILFIFSLFQRKKSLSVHQSRTVSSNSLSWFGNIFGIFVLFLYLLSMLGGVVFYSARGWYKIIEMTGLLNSVLSVLPSTLFLGVLTSIIIVALLTAVAFLYEVKWFQKLLKGLVAPSLSLIGFSIILLRAESSFLQYLYYALGFSIFIFPSLYRFGFDSALSGIKGQIEVAQVLGASNTLIFKEIIFPQVLSSALRLGGLSFIWFIGDFALSKYAFTEEKVTGQVVYSLMNSFRIDQAMAIMTFNLLLGFIVFYFLTRLSDVISEKS